MDEIARATILDVAAIASLTALAFLYDGDLVYIAAGWAAGRLGTSMSRGAASRSMPRVEGPSDPPIHE